MAIANTILNTASSINSVGQYAEAIYNQYIVTSSTLPEGVQGFVFDIFKENSIELEAEITDHYVEDNSYMQDHIAERPERVSLSGLVGELTMQDTIGSVRDALNSDNLSVSDVLNNNALIDTATQKMGILEALLPPLSNRDYNLFMKAQDAYRQSTALLRKGQELNLYELFEQKAVAVTKQAKAFQFFQEALKNRISLIVVTPFQELDNMFIESIRANRSESTGVSNFEVRLKRVRTAQTKVTQKKAVGRTAMQKQETVDHGLDNGKKVSDEMKATIGAGYTRALFGGDFDYKIKL